KKNRHPFYNTNEKREALREQIFQELIKNNRLSDDDQISIGRGGAMPSSLAKEGKAFIVIGLPASGKSTIASKIAKEYNAAIVDSDYAKRKFPEYSLLQGSSIVHDEATLVTFGSEEANVNEPNVYEYLTGQKANIVIPKIGHDIRSVLGLRDDLLKEGPLQYNEVHLVLVSVDRETSTSRALDRFIRTQRYVPLGLVFDAFANDPTLTYYRVKDCDKWASTGKVTTKGSNPKLVCCSSDQNPVFVLFGGADESK
ncbi:zeta toxin family protein, partial [Vibrio alginolyticus]